MNAPIEMVMICMAAFSICGYSSSAAQLPTYETPASARHGAAPAPTERPRWHSPSAHNGPPLHVGDTVAPLHIRGLTAYGALQDISRKANLVIGLEATMYRTDKAIEFDFPGGTVTGLLDAFVAHAPDFKWQDDGGIIHVFRDGRHVPLADLVLDYPGASNAIRFDIWRSLHRRPEYIAWMNSSHCRAAERWRPWYFKYDSGPIDIPAGRVSVSQLLDYEATKTGDGFWAVLQSDSLDGPCMVAIIDWSWPD